ncbi:MAG: ATP-binding protein [Bacteroidales bacterium]|nr:ATP-binding protein [Bacteroidales bacterium]
MYYKRLIDSYLSKWATDKSHKPLLLRGARQVGKSTAVRHLGEQFEFFVEVNFEKQPIYKSLFLADIDVKRIVSQMSAIAGVAIEAGRTLLFLDEIQSCPEAIMALRFFKEDLPDLHVIAAGSLLEFALAELPTFGVGRIHSMFMYPMSFDEFLMANGEQKLIDARNEATAKQPLPEPLHLKCIELLRTYMLVGGMPEVVNRWVDSHNYIACQELQDDIIVAYEDDFPKYKKRVDPILLRQTLRSVAVQATQKFVYSRVGDYKHAEVKAAVELLILAGLITPVTHTNANGLPLGSETDNSYRKMLLLDSGLMLRLLNMSIGDVTDITTQILTDSVSDLVNKGPMAEMIAGLELLRYNSPNIRHDLFYWLRMTKNSLAEVDYVFAYKSKVLPIEVKANTQGGMKSLWAFMHEKKLSLAVRCSLENFGEFDNVDTTNSDNSRHIVVCPLYAMSQFQRLLEE